MTYPVMLDGARFNALVVGGGAVAARKAKNLLDGGMTVTVIAPEICAELKELVTAQSRLRLVERVYQQSDIADANIIVAATNDARVNTAVARDATTRGLLVNVADDPTAGNFVTPAVHRSGDLTIAVSSGRTPAVAAAVRAELARRFDGRYATAIRSLRSLREKLLGAGRREEWKRASNELVTDEFCDRVEQGRIEEQVAAWR